MKLNLVVKLTHMDENEWKDNIDEADNMNLLKGMVPHGWKWPWKWWILMKFHNMNEISYSTSFARVYVIVTWGVMILPLIFMEVEFFFFFFFTFNNLVWENGQP